MEHSVLACRGELIGVEDLPPECRETGIRERLTPRNQRDLITEALKKTGGNRTEAARLLGISRATL